jgi:ribosomal protein S5
VTVAVRIACWTVECGYFVSSHSCAVPPAKAGSSSQLIQTVFDLIGIEHASAKIIGGKRRNKHMVVQALFDAFNNHLPPEESAYNRGLRMQWITSDRHAKGNIFPEFPKGPRHIRSVYKK